MSNVTASAVAAGYALQPLSGATADGYLRRARHTLFQLCVRLRTLAEHAAHFALTPNPHLPGSPDLSEVRAELRLYYDMALICAVDTGRFRSQGRDQWEPFAPYALLKAGGERPPQPVEDTPYTFLAVIRLATRVQTIGWNEPGRLRMAGDQWHLETPAERLRDAGRWRLPPHPPLPYFGHKAVYDEFVAALMREFDRAEQALARLQSDADRNRESPQAGGPFDDLRKYARTELKGQERAVIEALCDADGEMPLGELAVRDGVSWSDPDAGFKGVQRRLQGKHGKAKFKKRWRLRRHGNRVRVIEPGEAKGR